LSEKISINLAILYWALGISRSSLDLPEEAAIELLTFRWLPPEVEPGSVFIFGLVVGIVSAFALVPGRILFGVGSGLVLLTQIAWLFYHRHEVYRDPPWELPAVVALAVASFIVILALRVRNRLGHIASALWCMLPLLIALRGPFTFSGRSRQLEAVLREFSSQITIPASTFLMLLGWAIASIGVSPLLSRYRNLPSTEE
jgi:hypothetical protein